MKDKKLLPLILPGLVILQLFSYSEYTLGSTKIADPAKVEQAQSYFYKGNFDKALQMYLELIQEYPDNATFRLTLSQIFIEKFDLLKAEEQLLKAILLNPSDVQAHYLLANIAYFRGNYSRAVEECSKALAIDPDFYAARMQLADAYIADLDQVHAQEELQRLFAATPGSAALHFRKGEIYASLGGDLEKGIVELEAAARIRPGISRIWAELGGYYLRTGNYTKAVDSFKKAMEISPQNTESRYGLGQAYQSLDRIDEALVEYEAVQKKMPNNIWLSQSLAGIYYKKSQYGKLRDICLQGIEAYPNSPDFHFMLAIADYYLQGRENLEQAQEHLKITLQLNKSYPQAKEWLEKIAQMVNDNKAITSRLPAPLKTAHYAIRTNLPEYITDRLVREGMADKVFEDSVKFVSGLMQKEIAIPSVTVTIFKNNKEYRQYYDYSHGSIGKSMPAINEIIIDGSEPASLELTLFHETVHVLIEKSLPTHYQWLCESLAGVTDFDSYWSQGHDEFNKLLASPDFDSLDENVIKGEYNQDRYFIYHAFGSFLVERYYKELQDFLKLLQAGKEPAGSFDAAFKDSRAMLGPQFREFVRLAVSRQAAVKLLTMGNCAEISYKHYHPAVESEDILVSLLSRWLSYIGEAVLWENGVASESIKAKIKKGAGPSYGKMSEEALRILFLASAKLRNRQRSYILVDEYLLAALEDGNNRVVTLLKDLSVDVQALRKHLSDVIKNFDATGRVFFPVADDASFEAGMKLYYRISALDNKMEIFYRDRSVAKLAVREKGTYEQRGLESTRLKSFQPVGVSGPDRLTIKQGDAVICEIPIVFPYESPAPVIKYLKFYPDTGRDVLIRNISRLEFEPVSWSNKSSALISFKQKGKIYTVTDTPQSGNELFIDLFYNPVAYVPHEIEEGDVEVTLQSVIGLRKSKPSYPVILTVMPQEPPKIISLNKYSFKPGEKIVIKGNNFSGADQSNSVLLTSLKLPASIVKKNSELESTLDDYMPHATQILEIVVPKATGLRGKVPLKVKVYDLVSNEVFIDILQP